MTGGWTSWCAIRRIATPWEVDVISIGIQILMHHPRLAHQLSHHLELRLVLVRHPQMFHHFANTYVEYKRGMRFLLADDARGRHYCHWLVEFIRSHHRLPGIDLLLGS